MVTVALSSEAEPVGRAALLADLAAACGAAGDTAAAEDALAPAVDLLNAAVSRPGFDRRELAGVGVVVGRTAVVFERHDFARKAFLVAAAALEHDHENELLPAAWYGAGWASACEGDGPHAVEYLRNAAGVADGDVSLRDRVEILRSLAEAERVWGDDGRCDAALHAGCEAIRGAAAASSDDDRRDLAALAGLLRHHAERLERQVPAAAVRDLERSLGGGE